MLIGCIFLASLCFSVIVEAVQTLIHIDHQDEMHFPLVILMVGAAGLLLNGFCYSLIGGNFKKRNESSPFSLFYILFKKKSTCFSGYTFHQGSYLHVTENGEVILERIMTVDTLRKDQRRLSGQSRKFNSSSTDFGQTQRQGLKEMIRDIIGE